MLETKYCFGFIAKLFRASVYNSEFCLHLREQSSDKSSCHPKTWNWNHLYLFTIKLFQCGFKTKCKLADLGCCQLGS